MPLVQTPSLGRRRLDPGMSAAATSLLVPVRPQLARAALSRPRARPWVLSIPAIGRATLTTIWLS